MAYARTHCSVRESFISEMTGDMRNSGLGKLFMINLWAFKVRERRFGRSVSLRFRRVRRKYVVSVGQEFLVSV